MRRLWLIQTCQPLLKEPGRFSLKTREIWTSTREIYRNAFMYQKTHFYVLKCSLCSSTGAFLAILEPGNVALNRGPAWSAVAKGRLYSIKKFVNRSSAFITSSLSFSSEEFLQKRLDKVCCYLLKTQEIGKKPGDFHKTREPGRLVKTGRSPG